jgi:hypothetical protein
MEAAMPHPTWRERFRQALRDRALPRAKIDRLVEEISSHIDELIMENPGMDAQALVESRLGSPEQVAAFAKTQLSKIPLWSRPTVTFLIFAVGPLFAVILSGLVTILGFVSLVLVAESDVPAPSYTTVNVLAFAIDYAVRVLPLVAATWLFVYLGRRLKRHSWSIASCCIIAVTALCYTTWVMPKTDWQQGSFGLNVGFQWEVDRLLRAMLPLLLATWMLMRSKSALRNIRGNQDESPVGLAA